MFADEEGWEDGTAVKERIAEREHRMIVEEAKASLSTCEFCQENHCVDESFPCSCRGPGGVCQATPDDLIEACCPDPACCYAGWDGRHCDCGAECEGCQVGAIMRAPEVVENRKM